MIFVDHIGLGIVLLFCLRGQLGMNLSTKAKDTLTELVVVFLEWRGIVSSRCDPRTARTHSSRTTGLGFGI